MVRFLGQPANCTSFPDAAATDIQDTVLAETTFDAANSSAGWNCLPDTTPGSVCTYTIGTLGGGTGSSASAANAQQSTPIVAAVDLRMVKTDDDVTAAVGKVINYMLMHFNDGDRDAVDVGLTETVPANTSFYPPGTLLCILPHI